MNQRIRQARSTHAWTWLFRVLLRLLPLLITLGGWRLSLALNDVLGCHSVGKTPEACRVLGWDLQPLLAFGAWWGMLLWVPALFVSGAWLGSLLAKALPKPWGRGSA